MPIPLVRPLVDPAIFLDIVALLPPVTGLALFLKRKASLNDIKVAVAIWTSLFFVGGVIFDLLLLQGFTWAANGVLASVTLVVAGVGFLAANLCFCPESSSMRQSFSTVTRSASYLAYMAVIVGWLTITIYTKAPYLPANILLWAAITVYPTLLFLTARKRATVAHSRDLLTVLSIVWVLQAMLMLPTIMFATGASTLGITLPFGYQFAFLTSSLFFYFMSVSVADPTWLTRLWVSRLVPQTIIELGRRYLIIHDTGGRTLSFLSNTFRNFVESGSRVIVTGRHSWLIEAMVQTEPRFTEWVRSGKIINTLETPATTTMMHALSEKMSLGKASTVYVKSLDPGALSNATAPPRETPSEKGHTVSELFLLESNRAPRPQLHEFQEKNGDIRIVDLSEHKDYFSALVKLEHEQLQGSKILLEYNTEGDLVVVENFLMEGIGYAEKCVLFTSKSSKVYRAIKGKELVKIVAASSLVSAPDELPDGEVQIPDRELGLVTSITADLLENNRTTATRFVFDSIEELITGERWEQLYSGVKQVVELLNVPQATALFLVNNGTAEPRFLGALKALFSVQMRLDSTGLQIRKF